MQEKPTLKEIIYQVVTLSPVELVKLGWLEELFEVFDDCQFETDNDGNEIVYTNRKSS